MRPRERGQKGSIFRRNGKVWIRYHERHAGASARPVACLGTEEQLNSQKKIDAAQRNFMVKVDENLVVTQWGSLCDKFIAHGISSPKESDSYINRRSMANTLRHATYPGRKGEPVPFARERLDHLATPAGRTKLEDWLNETVMSANYRRGMKSMMRRIFRYAHKQGYLQADHNPADLIDIRNQPYSTNPQREREFVTAEQYEALMNDPLLPLYCKVMLTIMYNTGVRGCEVLGLSWEHGRPGDRDYREADITFATDPPKIWVRRSWQRIREIDRAEKQAAQPMPGKRQRLNRAKTEKAKRTVPLSEEVVAALIHWKSTELIVNDWVFGSSQKAAHGRPYHPTTVRRQFQLAARRHGFGLDLGFGLHNNRHTYCKDAEDAGSTVEERMDMFGHNNPQTTRGYGGNDHARKLVPLAQRVVDIRAARRAQSLTATKLPQSNVKPA